MKKNAELRVWIEIVFILIGTVFTSFIFAVLAFMLGAFLSNSLFLLLFGWAGLCISATVGLMLSMELLDKLYRRKQA